MMETVKRDENEDGDEDETERDERKKKISRRVIKNVRNTLFTEHFFRIS